MFKNKKEFIQAMLDGRKFREGVSVYEFDSESCHVFHGIGRFDMYDSVSEILSEPKLFNPKPGDMIIVYNDKEEFERKFLGMFEDWFICEQGYYKRPSFWEHAKAIPEETKWYNHDGKSWPRCLPGKNIEIKTRAGKTSKGIADIFAWYYTEDTESEEYDIIQWRYLEGKIY